MKDATFLVGLGIIAVTVLECWAMSRGFNGEILTYVLVAIVGVIMYLIKSPLYKK